jgi:hypothetical protein
LAPSSTEFGEDPIEASAFGGVQRCHPIDVLGLLQRPNLTQLPKIVLRDILGPVESIFPYIYTYIYADVNS